MNSGMQGAGLTATEQAIRDKGLTAPRVTPADIDAAISSAHFVRGNRLALEGQVGATPPRDLGPLGCLTICVLVLHNGFTVVGKSACASPENFDAELGERIALEDAKRQLWPLLGYALRDRLNALELVKPGIGTCGACGHRTSQLYLTNRERVLCGSCCAGWEVDTARNVMVEPS